MVMVFCNYVNVEWMIIGFMALAFFGKGIGALGWAVMADTAQKRSAVFPVACSTCSVTFLASSRQSQLVISLARLAPLHGALIYVGVHALIAVLSYLVLVGDIKRIELKPVAGQSS